MRNAFAGVYNTHTINHCLYLFISLIIFLSQMSSVSTHVPYMYVSEDAYGEDVWTKMRKRTGRMLSLILVTENEI